MNIRQWICYGVFLLLGPNLQAQTVNLTDVCTFPSVVNESSGIVKLDTQRVLTHNDSGDSSRIFIYNHVTCMIEKQVFIRDHTAIDIESITLDDSGYVYVADMGNNLGGRTNLCILKLKLQDMETMDTVDAQKIFFSYADQVSFSSSNHNFDAEAFFHHNDSLFIFSKNHGVAGNYCKRYVLPDTEGTYSVAPKDSIALASWVTDAAIDPAHQHFVLVSEQKLYLFGLHTGLADLSLPLHTLDFTFASQKEGISFLNADSVVVTDEYVFGTGGKLYLADLSPWLGLSQVQKGESGVVVINHNGWLGFTNPNTGVLQYSIYNMQGQLMNHGTLQAGQRFDGHYGQSGLLLLMGGDWQKVVKF